MVTQHIGECDWREQNAKKNGDSVNFRNYVKQFLFIIIILFFSKD
jgi:hypothetical protein